MTTPYDKIPRSSAAGFFISLFDYCRKEVFLFCLILLLLTPAAVLAHAFPDHSDPRVGASIDSSPAQVRIWFDGALEPAFSKIMVHNANSEMVDKRDGRVNPSDAKLLEVSVPRLPAGTYRVIWDVLARDGHRTKGDFTFTIK